jgi:hypothetical protein
LKTEFKLTAGYRRILEHVSRKSGQLQKWDFMLVDRPRVDELVSRGFLELIKDPVEKDGSGRPIEILGITEAGRALLHPPLKPRKTIPRRREPKGPGMAEHMFTDAGGERVELLAFYSQTLDGEPMCGFEVNARVHLGRFWDQVAAGEADSIEEAKIAALEMIARPRDKWDVLPRSWVKNSTLQ